MTNRRREKSKQRKNNIKKKKTGKGELKGKLNLRNPQKKGLKENTG